MVIPWRDSFMVSQYRIRFLRLIEGFVKELCCCLFFFFSCWLFIRKNAKQQYKHAIMGIICQEFFRKDLGGFGGYGMTVKNITDYYNSQPNGLTTKVIMPQDLGLVKEPDVRRVHNADALLLPSLMKLVLHPIRYCRKIDSLNMAFFLTIDYLLRYEYVLWAAPRIPLVIYIRDPRSKAVWETIGSVPQEIAANMRSTKKDLIGIAAQHAASFRRVRRWSALTGRKVIFATNADFLTKRAESEFDLKQLRPYYLPNPLPMPEVREIMYDATPMLLALGRLDPQKRPWILFELAKRFPQVNFNICGQSRFPELLGPDMDRYRQLPNLHFLGVVEGREKDALLRRCWALVNTSIHEGLPVSFLETFSYGKCVISCLNPAGLVERFGYFTGEFQGPGLDEKALGDFEKSVEACLTDEGERRRKGRLALEYVRRNHTFEKFHTHLTDMLGKEGILPG
jgi:glycosyltransferase involved in cell wall biosynthesis